LVEYLPITPLGPLLWRVSYETLALPCVSWEERIPNNKGARGSTKESCPILLMEAEESLVDIEECMLHSQSSVGGVIGDELCWKSR
jgi:hypothetical protein